VVDVGGGFNLLFLHLAIESPPGELSWAQGVLNANRDKPVMVSLHRYMQDATDYTAGVPLVPSGRYPDIWYSFEDLYRPDGIRSEIFFNSFIKANKNIFLIHCGHFHGEHRQVSTNNAGLPVQEILADYQDDPNGGDGYLRIMKFRPSLNRVEVQSYSTTLNRYKTGGDSQFNLSVDLNRYRYSAGTSAIRFQNGVGGYNGTQDTYVTDNDRNGNKGNNTLIVVDNDEANNPFTDYPTQGLLRFDDIFAAGPVYEGDPAPTRIPSNAVVTAATLTYNVVDDVDIGDEDMFVHRCLIPWDENSTWNSLVNGVQGSDVSSERIEVDGDNDPNGQTIRNVNVTTFVQAWKNGQPNYGFAILPENTPWNDDGMDIASSEYGDTALRPALSVDFTYTVLNRPPTVRALAASRLTVNEGESIVLTMGATDPNPEDPLVFKMDGQQTGFAVGSGDVSKIVVMQDEGTYTFSGTISDDETTVSGGSVAVRVNNLPPVITQLTSNLTVQAGQLFPFAVTATDPGPTDVLTYAWDLDNDGLYDDATGATGNWSFTENGTYPIRVRVSDGDGGVVTGSFTVEVTGGPRPGYLAWAANYGLRGTFKDDDDFDGIDNATEHKLGSDPRRFGSRFSTRVRSVSPANRVTFEYSFVVPGLTFGLYCWTVEDKTWTLVHRFTPTSLGFGVTVEHNLPADRPSAMYKVSLTDPAP
jgi:hypothetical protein